MKYVDSLGVDKVYLTGSRRTIERVVYIKDGKFFVVWYGNIIEVKKGSSGYYSVDAY